MSAGASLLNCTCDEGYECVYRRAVRVVVHLPYTVSQFTAMQGQFIQAVADAAGVSPSQVTIVAVRPRGSARRRLLEHDEGRGTLLERDEGRRRALLEHEESQQDHEATQIGVMLGMSASKRSSMDQEVSLSLSLSLSLSHLLNSFRLKRI